MKFSTFVCCLCISSAALADTTAPALFPQTMALSAEDEAHPEARLVAALDRLAAGQAAMAMQALAQLVKERPNFQLAQLIYGDLLQAQAGGVNGLKLNSRNQRLRALIEEARLRWGQRQAAPPADAVPNVLLRLALREERVVLVDLKASRLYLMWSVGQRPRVLEDHYVGIGKAGFGKRREGDRRTPVGVYRVTEYLSQAALEDLYDDEALLYGAGALPISYPNLHDRLLQRTGSGIWLHGVPDQTYVRPPRSSRGCVTMANDDFTALLKDVVPGHTLVIFSDEVEWISPAEAKAREQGIMAALQQWQQDWASADSDAFFEHYADSFKTEDTDLGGFIDYQQRLRAARGNSEIDIDNLSLMAYPGESNIMLATFRQAYQSDGLRAFIRKQQYWQRGQDGRWRIIREGLDNA